MQRSYDQINCWGFVKMLWKDAACCMYETSRFGVYLAVTEKYVITI